MTLKIEYLTDSQIAPIMNAKKERVSATELFPSLLTEDLRLTDDPREATWLFADNYYDYLLLRLEGGVPVALVHNNFEP